MARSIRVKTTTGRRPGAARPMAGALTRQALSPRQLTWGAENRARLRFQEPEDAVGGNTG
jgi:hypothetical protein